MVSIPTLFLLRTLTINTRLRMVMVTQSKTSAVALMDTPMIICLFDTSAAPLPYDVVSVFDVALNGGVLDESVVLEPGGVTR